MTDNLNYILEPWVHGIKTLVLVPATGGGSIKPTNPPLIRSRVRALERRTYAVERQFTYLLAYYLKYKLLVLKEISK